MQHPVNDEFQNLNVKALLQDVIQHLERCMDTYEGDATYANVRPSDTKMFMSISSEPRTISQLARTLNISRQAAHASIGRLVDWGVVELKPAEGSRRDKIAVVTQEGEKARDLEAQRINFAKLNVEARIGKEKIRMLCEILREILQAPPPAGD